MEIQQLRKEFNQQLEKINQQSERFTEQSHLPSLEASVILSKITKLQEIAAVLKYTIEQNEDKTNQKRRDYQQAVRREDAKEEPILEEKEENDEIAEPKEGIIESTTIINEEVIAIDEKEKGEDNSASSIGDKLSESPIVSLKDAFSLNDRYLFANELFNKDMTLFNEAIKVLDAAENEILAMDKLRELGISLNWDLEDENLISLQNMVQRRFL